MKNNDGTEFRHNTVSSLISCNYYENHHTMSYTVMISELWLIHSTAHFWHLQENFEGLQLFPETLQNILTTRKSMCCWVYICYYFYFRVTYALLFWGSSYTAIPEDKLKHNCHDLKYLMRQCVTYLCQEGNHKDEKLCLPLPNIVTKFQLSDRGREQDIQAMNFSDVLSMDGANKSHKHSFKMI